MKVKSIFLKCNPSISKKCLHPILIQRTFCEALFEVLDDYEYDSFRHAISNADGVDVIQRKMGTVKYINAQKNRLVHASIYSAAIKRAQELNEYSECWRLYNEAKHESEIDIYLLTQMINVTAQFVESQFMFDYDHKNSRMYNKSKLETAKHKMLCRVHQLYNEMRNELNLKPTNATYSSLINACSKFKSFVGAQRYWQLYCDDQDTAQRDITVYSAIIYSKVSKTDMIGAMRLLHEMVDVHHIAPNAYIVSKVLSGFARSIQLRKQNKSKFMEISDLIDNAEHLIKIHLRHKHMNDTMEIEIFNGICNVYASNGDVTSCFDILHGLMDKRFPVANHYQMYDVPSPNVYTFNTCLKSLVYTDELHASKSKDNLWRLAQFILDKMKAFGIERDCTTYSTLFHLCGNSMDEDIKPDLDKAIAFYLELSNSTSVITKKCMYSLLRTGLQFYDHCQKHNNEPKQNKHEFVEWWLSEAKDYRVQCSLSLEQLLDIEAKKLRVSK